MDREKKHVLVVAYACEPNKTSEPGVGWNLTKEISKKYKTTVLTRKNNQKNIESEKKDERTFIYYDLPSFFLKMKKILPLGTQLYFLFWQWGAYFYAKKHIKNFESDIDLVHHLTFGISWTSPPSFILNKKFIWGPIGGGDIAPLSLFKELDYKSKLQESIYFLLNKLGRYSPFSYLIRKNADAIIFRTESLKSNFKRTSTNILPIISETASVEIEIKPPKKHNTFIYALSIGRMIYGKETMLSVKGFHEYLKRGGKGKLELLGAGYDFERVKNYIKEHKLEQHIIARGFVSGDVVHQKLSEASVLLHPSFREGGSWAIMEAMTYGLPVVCLNRSGPKDMVTKECGILIDTHSQNQVIDDIANSLMQLSSKKDLFEKLSKNAQKRIQTQYTWQKRGEQIAEIYEMVLNKGLK